MEFSPDLFTMHLNNDLGHLLGSEKRLEMIGSTRAAAARHQAASIFKKLKVDNSAYLDSVACAKFISSNQKCAQWVNSSASVQDDQLLGDFRKEIYNFWFVRDGSGGSALVSNPGHVLHYAMPGPGAAIGARGGDFYTKLFAGPLTCTRSSLYDEYKRYVSTFPNWAEAERLRSVHYGQGIVVSGSKLSFVPKNDKTSRGICIEPGLNIVFQKGFGDILRTRIRQFYGINLIDQQTRNRKLAQLGSFTGRRVTLDLESASDTISLKMIENFFPPDFVWWLKYLRSPSVELPNGQSEQLNMISSMGNGYTFDLQTIIFTACVVAVYKEAEIPLRFPRGKRLGNFAVNGDDIVVDRRCGRRLCHLLQLLGFTVNREKSFFEGPFRESCGGDYHYGRPIRPYFIKRYDTEHDLYAIINGLNQWSATTGILLPRCIWYLLTLVRWRPIPWYEDDSAGIKTLATDRPKKRHPGFQSGYYYPLVSTASFLSVGSEAVTAPRGAKKRIFNPSGLELACLAGVVRLHKIGIRHDPIRWRQIRRVAPSWEHMGEPVGLIGKSAADRYHASFKRVLSLLVRRDTP